MVHSCTTFVLHRRVSGKQQLSQWTEILSNIEPQLNQCKMDNTGLTEQQMPKVFH